MGTHGCVSQGLGDVCFLKLRKFGENLGGCHLVRDHRDHSRHWDAQAPDAWHASHHVGVDGDAVTRMSIRLAGDSTLGRFSTSRLGLSSAKSKPEGDFGTACGAVSGGDAGVVALAEGVDDGQSKPGAAGGARGVGGFRESRADCGEQFGVASWTPQGEFEFGGQEAKGVRSSWPASLTN